MTPNKAAKHLIETFGQELAQKILDNILYITETPVITIDSNGIERQHGWQNDSYWMSVKEEKEKL